MIPKEWSLEPAEKVCEAVIDCKNRTPPVIEDGEYAVVRTPNVRDGQFVRDELRFTDKESYEIWTQRGKPRPGDVLITREAPLGEVCLVPEDLSVCLGQRMMMYRPDPKKLDSVFLRYALMSHPVQKRLLRKSGGSTVGHAKVGDIRSLEVPVPPLKEQKKIAEILSTWDRALINLKRLIQVREAKYNGVMSWIFTKDESKDPPIPMEEVRLSDVCSQIIDGTHFTPRYTNSGVPFISVENISRDDFVNTKFISEEEHKKISKRCSVTRGDILMTRIGSLGHTKMVDWDHESSIYVSLALIRSKIAEDSNYIYEFTKSEMFRREVWKRSLTNASPMKINLNDIGAVQILMPKNTKDQRKVVEVLESMRTEISLLKKLKESWGLQKLGLMQHLLTGKTRVKV